MQVPPPFGQICNQMLVTHLVAKLATNSSCTTEINFELFLLKDWLKLWTQYPGFVVSLAMGFFSLAIWFVVISRDRSIVSWIGMHVCHIIFTCNSHAQKQHPLQWWIPVLLEYLPLPQQVDHECLVEIIFSFLTKVTNSDLSQCAHPTSLWWSYVSLCPGKNTIKDVCVGIKSD